MECIGILNHRPRSISTVQVYRKKTETALLRRFFVGWSILLVANSHSSTLAPIELTSITMTFVADALSCPDFRLIICSARRSTCDPQLSQSDRS
jgi:hypothetical protein